MAKDREKLYQIYHTILSMMLAWAMALAINAYYELKVNAAVSLLFSMILAALIYLFDRNRKNPVSYLIVLGIIPVLLFFFWIMHINVFSWFGALVNWIRVYDYTEERYAASYAHVVLLAVTLAGTAAFYLLMKKQAAKVLLAISLLAMLIMMSVLKIDINKIVIMICIFYMLSIIIELGGNIYSRRAGRPEKKAGILYLAPVCLLLAVISISLPSKPEPIQWKGVKAIYHTVKDKIDSLLTDWEFFRGGGMGEFSVAFAGYSEDEKNLGAGSLSQDDKVSLRISGNRGNAPIYLIGSVSDIYTGYSWEKSRTDSLPGESDYSLDYMELVYALSRLDRELLENYRFVDRRLIKITYDNIRTKTFFYPIKSSWFEIYSGTEEPDYEYSDIVFRKSAGRGTVYEAIFFEMNLQSPQFRQMLKDADTFSYEAGGDINIDNLYWLESNLFLHDSAASIMKRWDFYEVLKARAELIRENYTALPESLPDRVYKLADQITEGRGTTYDKLKAIEEYLLGYSYTIKPGKLPEGEDFADYFLFENKKGYCTSFATSMAVLARCLGIPARYAEGFIMDYSEKEETEYLVKNYKAHSWAEAYIEGIGWIPFEATPPFYENRYVAWREKNPIQDNVPDYLRHYEEERRPYIPEEKPVKVEVKGMPGALIVFIIVVFTVLVLFLIFSVYYIMLRYRYRKKFEKSDSGGKMYLLFLRILTILKREGFSMDSQDTVLMLNDRVRDRYHYDKVVFLDVAKVFMRYRYAQLPVTEAELNKVDRYYNGLMDKQREETGRLKLYLEEFLFLSRKGNR